MINNKEINMSDDEVTEALKPTVAEYTAPVLLGAILVLLGLGVALIWGLDWRVFWSACVLAIAAVIAAAFGDGRRKEHARLAREAAFRQAMANNPMGRILQPISRTLLGDLQADDPKEPRNREKDQP